MQAVAQVAIPLGRNAWSEPGLDLQISQKAAQSYNLLRPLLKISFLLAPYGYITIKIKKNS